MIPGLDRMRPPKLVGVVNITADSFSDGGLFLDPDKAIAHARHLLAAGADIIELGAASSHPDSRDVSPSEEIARLGPVLDALQHDGAVLSVDSTTPEVQRFCMARGIHIVNDIRGFPDRAFHEALAVSDARLVVMHSVDQAPRAKRRPTEPSGVFDSMRDFFRGRLQQLTSAGVAHERLIIDPGMGYFLGSNPETSLAVLGRLAELRSLFGCPLLVSVSRKSFLRNLASAGECDIQSRTLAAELFAASEGADYIRTHDVGPLHQALVTQAAIADARTLIP